MNVRELCSSHRPVSPVYASRFLTSRMPARNQTSALLTLVVEVHVRVDIRSWVLVVPDAQLDEVIVRQLRVAFFV